MINIRIYQIDTDRDCNRVTFEPLERLEQRQGTPEVDASLYDLVFDGAIRTCSLEELYKIFNTERPAGYKGRSMSISDVIEVEGPEGKSSQFFYCDKIGFRRIRFESDKGKTN